MSLEHKDKILQALRDTRAPLPLDALPYGKRTEWALEELVAAGQVILGPNIPQRTWSLPAFVGNEPKRNSKHRHS